MSVPEQAVEPRPAARASRPCAAFVFASREGSAAVAANMDALRLAGGEDLAVHLLVNGNPQLAQQLESSARADPRRFRGVRIWFCPFGDKAHAWNESVHTVWDGQSWVFNVDGYVIVRPDSLQRLLEDLIAHSGFLAATGVPTVGRSSHALRDAMLRDGGLHGNLFLMNPGTVRAFRDQGIRLPIGLYRTDSTIGAIMAFGMDPAENAWSPRTRLWVDPEVSWTTPDKDWWRPAELRAWWKRRVRQARGALENEAVRYHLAVERRSPAALATHVDLLVGRWAAEDPRGFDNAVRRHPTAREFARQALNSAASAAARESPPPMTLRYTPPE